MNGAGRRGFDDLQARAQPQVEGVAEDDLGADVAQVLRRCL
jgi:hypothetical protein